MSSMTASGASAATRARCAVARCMAPPGEGHHPHAGGLRRHDAGRAVLDDQAGGGSVAEAPGGVQEEVGGRLAVRDHGRGEGAASKRGQSPATSSESSDALGLRGGGDAVGAGQRVEGLGDARDRPQLGAEGGVERAAHVVERGVGDGEAVVAGEDLARRGERAAEEERVGLGGGRARRRRRRGFRAAGAARSARCRRARRRSRR